MKKTFTFYTDITPDHARCLLAQDDSAAYERRPFQFTFLFPPLSTNGAKN